MLSRLWVFTISSFLYLSFISGVCPIGHAIIFFCILLMVNRAHIASSIFTNSAVVVNEDIGHGAIIYPSMCLGRIINKYLLDGTLPPNGTVCESEVKDPVERYFGDDGEGNDGGGEGLEKVEGLDQEAGMKYGK